MGLFDKFRERGIVSPKRNMASKEVKQDPKDIRLDDNTPIYHLFLEQQGNEPITNKDDVMAAKNKLAAYDLETLRQCQGRNKEEAMEILGLNNPKNQSIAV